MTISIWRYSHLSLAVSSFLFIILASVTGIILAIEPVAQKVQPYSSHNFNSIKLNDDVSVLKEKYSDISELVVDDNDFVIIKTLNDSGDNIEIYVDPVSGKQLGIVKKQNAFFQWTTNLHRSLFLKSTGRFIIGLTSFLLMLIAISGSILIIKRQRGVRRFFSKIVKDGFAQYYHVVLGRLFLIVIIIISLSGVILSLGKFGVIKEAKVIHNVDFDSLKSSPKKEFKDFSGFKNIKLSEVKSLEFPFSEDIEDYFTLKLKEKELTVNQNTGDVLTEQLFPSSTWITNLSMNLHTGRTSSVWAIILAIACLNILFFIYSGFIITLKRRAGKISNRFKYDEADFIILVGSENGSTSKFAKEIQKQLILEGQKVYLTELNNYKVFPKAKYILAITATYGLGDPPENATKFKDVLNKYPQAQEVKFSVLGFGSHSYPDFCKFAFEVNNQLSKEAWAVPLLEIHTVNDHSLQDFSNWLQQWSQKVEVPLIIPEKLFIKPKGLKKLIVINKKVSGDEDGSFLITLKLLTFSGYRSGDLLAIYPANDHRERLYSIGKVNGQLQLSVKLHPNGLGSEFLNSLEIGGILKGKIIPNKHFYFPAKASKVIMISNGTGIAPFLGMINENDGVIKCELYCGFRANSSFNLYSEDLKKATENKKLQQLNLAFSRQGVKQYVSHLLQNDSDKIASALESHSVLMICGSLSMQKDVIELLDLICKTKNNKPLSYYQSRGQVIMDCY